jgi:DNA-binding transcriptional ArsR family regulator
MVERSNRLDSVFGSLSDPTRRDILKRLGRKSMTVSEIAEPYDLTFAAVAKHLEVLQAAGLVTKTKKGREQIVTLAPKALAAANTYLESYRDLWENRLDSLGEFLKNNKRKGSD